MDWKKIAGKLLFLPIGITLPGIVFSAVMLIYVFANGLESAWFAYGIYVLAFYTLTVFCVWCVRVFPKGYRSMRKKIYENPLGKRYLTDAIFRTNMSIYRSLCISVLYVGVNILSFVRNRSTWFLILAGYYSILAVMRFLLAHFVHNVNIGRDRLGELKRSRLCAIILLTINFVLSGAVLMILYQNKGFEYHGILIYAMAAYTFYITINAMLALVKYRKYNSPVITITKIISLSAALVSMLSLETAMFSQFGKATPLENKRLMVALTGAGVSITVIAMAVYVIVKNEKEIKQLRSNKNE